MMNSNRWQELMRYGDSQLTDQELADGWHFCWDWDGLLINPEMGEWGENPLECGCGFSPQIDRPQTDPGIYSEPWE